MWAFMAIAVAADGVAVGSANELRIDGYLDEPSWEHAQAIDSFERFQPTDGGAPEGRTSVRFLQDERALYVGIRVEQAGYTMRARISPREDINADDQVGIYLDTFLDGISGYIFYFNALGIQQDIRHNAGDWNVSWDTVLRSRGHVTEEGFELEIAIPWRSLKFPRGGTAQEWGAIVTRKIPREGAKYSWPKLELGQPRIFEGANRLRGVKPPARGSGMELVPSLIAGHSWPSDEPIRPLQTVRPSLDVRLGLTPDIGVAATLNPDFSQVESDISDVRLNAQFAFRFPERRRFFLDGVDWFDDRGNTLYTRTMNAPVYGVKVGGREGPISVGALHVLDRSPLPSFTEGGTPGFGEDDVADRLSSTSYLRARTDAFGLGYGGVTVSDKRLIGTDSHHQTVGVDLEAPMGDRWIGGGHLQHSFTAGGGDSLWGVSQSAVLQRATGIGTGGVLSYTHRTPGFRNEVGFVTQADVTEVLGSIDHTLPLGDAGRFTPQSWIGLKVEGNGDRRRSVGVGEDLIVAGVHRIGSGFFYEDFRERGTEVRGGGARVFYGGNLGRTFDLALNGAVNRSIDFELLVPATSLTSSITATLRPTAGIRNDLTLTGNRFAPKGGDPEASQLVRNRLNWQFTREIGARWVLDYSDGSTRKPQLFNALLVTWLRNPGTAVWVGGSLSRVPDEGTTSASIFAKATVLLRP